jgi:hypothetical protein
MAKSSTVAKTPAELAVETFQAISAKLMTWVETQRPKAAPGTASASGGGGGVSLPPATSSSRSRVAKARPKAAKVRAKQVSKAQVKPPTIGE